jgi:hypothetical protein
MTRYFYACCYRTLAEAELALVDCFATGELDYADAPTIESYVARNGKRYYGIKIRG